jgi:hypothetical protein
VIEHGRRRILHFNVTRHPKSAHVFETAIWQATRASGLHRYRPYAYPEIGQNEALDQLRKEGIPGDRTPVTVAPKNGAIMAGRKGPAMWLRDG